MDITRSIKQYPVAAFIVCAFLLSALISFAPISGENKFLLLGALLVPIPTLVAFALSPLVGGFRPFLRQVFNLHIDLRWALIAFGIALGARFAISILALATGAIPSLLMSAANPGIIIVIYLFALLEEIGWRGFAVNRLVRQHTPLVALLATALPWSAIHIFFYLNQGADAATLAQVFLLNFALSVMVTWAYLRGGQRVWIGVILHGSQSLFSILNTNIPPELSLPYSVIVYSVIALVIVAGDWRLWSTHPAEAEMAPRVVYNE